MTLYCNMSLGFFTKIVEIDVFSVNSAKNCLMNATALGRNDPNGRPWNIYVADLPRDGRAGP